MDSEKMKRMTREFEDTKAELARYEDKNLILTKRINRLEKENNELIENEDELRQEVCTSYTY